MKTRVTGDAHGMVFTIRNLKLWVWGVGRGVGGFGVIVYGLGFGVWMHHFFDALPEPNRRVIAVFAAPARRPFGGWGVGSGVRGSGFRNWGLRIGV